MILARGDRLALEAVLPRLAPAAVKPKPSAAPQGRDAEPAPVETEAGRRRRERENIERALATSGGKVYGKGGAAEILGLPGTTLASRMKVLGLRKR